MKNKLCVIIAMISIIAALSVDVSAISSIPQYTDSYVDGNTKLTEMTTRTANNSSGEGAGLFEGSPGDDWGDIEISDPIEDKSELLPDNTEVETPVEVEEQTPVYDRVTDPNGNFTEGSDFTESENPDTGSSPAFPAIISAVALVISAFLLIKKK